MTSGLYRYDTVGGDYGDALSRPFWEAAARHELFLQRCADCGRFQFYPRPFCLACQSDTVAWVSAAGTGTVYSQTTVHLQIAPEFDPPYIVAVVELDEGVRLTTNIIDGITEIGDRVRVAWLEREGLPPLPVFTPAAGD
jgi:uncharacterized OB-fold protein